MTLVVLDHDNPPKALNLSSITAASNVPTLVVLRREWEFLFQQLKSTYAVTRYIARAIDDGPIGFGREAIRYYEFAAADAAAAPGQLDQRYVALGTGPWSSMSTPLLPQAPAGHDDERLHDILRIILEDIAESPMSDAISERDRLEVLAVIDSMPVGHRTELGHKVLEFLDSVASVKQGEVRWHFRRFLRDGSEPQIAFGACTRFDPLIQEAFRQWVMLRHHEFAAVDGVKPTTTTVGILLTPRYDGLRPWDTTMFRVEGDLGLEDVEIEAIRRFWSQRDGD